jgi:hypothetical protein
VKRVYYVTGANKPYEYAKVGGPCEVALVGLRDLRLMRAVVREADALCTAQVTRPNEFPPLMRALARFNAQPGKGRGQ